MTARTASTGRPAGVLPNMPPRWVFTLLNIASRALMGVGIQLGFNGLITVRGRRTGLPRSTPVAIIEVSGRRWVWSPWGEVHWVRNLRAAGRATIWTRRRTEDVRAIELDEDERLGFFRDVLAPLVRGYPLGIQFIRFADGVDLNHPETIAPDRRVFELKPA